MIGLSVLLFTREKMHDEGIRGSIIIAVCRALILGKVLVDVGICVNTLMVCLNAGYTLLNTVPVCVKMVQAVLDGFASLHIFRKSLGRCMCLLALLSRLLGRLLLVLVLWIWQQL